MLCPPSPFRQIIPYYQCPHHLARIASTASVIESPVFFNRNISNVLHWNCMNMRHSPACGSDSPSVLSPFLQIILCHQGVSRSGMLIDTVRVYTRCAWAVRRVDDGCTMNLSTRSSPACPAPGRYRSMYSPWFSQSTGVRRFHQTGFWGSRCPLAHQMRRRKSARKTSSPRAGSLPKCSRFTSTYGMNPQRRLKRKRTQILSLTMFKRIPLDQIFHHIITDDRQALSATEPYPIGSMLFSPDEGRTTRHGASRMNPIRYSDESKTIQLRSRGSSCSPALFPFDLAKTSGFGRIQAGAFKDTGKRTNWHSDCLRPCHGSQ